jgi:shikimate kinase
MPGAGKSTVGVVLAKQLGMQFVDTDILIQVREQATLEQILEQQGYLALRAIEGQIIQQLDVQNSVIATGGSAVYNEVAMQNLQRVGKIIYLNVSPEQLSERLGDFAQRGIAAVATTSLEQLLNERLPLYKK